LPEKMFIIPLPTIEIKILIKKGLENITENDYINFANKKENK